ncbi:hypothetical protein PanWU01x14_317360 [Parasponia andersonii]|uniref:Uncharacterized protein n=1 Tax=Parasponia andersonii TaxID=3476 RepID=A0A2P5AMS7_PARAD|nr:hypothetical protein PanWU01x14_317360 [Parasponia andersonii]
MGAAKNDEDDGEKVHGKSLQDAAASFKVSLIEFIYFPLVPFGTMSILMAAQSLASLKTSPTKGTLEVLSRD